MKEGGHIRISLQIQVGQETFVSCLGELDYWFEGGCNLLRVTIADIKNYIQ